MTTPPSIETAFLIEAVRKLEQARLRSLYARRRTLKSELHDIEQEIKELEKNAPLDKANKSR